MLMFYISARESHALITEGLFTTLCGQFTTVSTFFSICLATSGFLMERKVRTSAFTDVTLLSDFHLSRDRSAIISVGGCTVRKSKSITREIQNIRDRMTRVTKTCVVATLCCQQTILLQHVFIISPCKVF